MGTVSESDLHDVVQLLGPDDMHKLYQALTIPHHDVQKAEESADTTNADLKASSILRWWRKVKGELATRETILQALEKCQNVDTKEKLESMWNTKGPASACSVPISQTNIGGNQSIIYGNQINVYEGNQTSAPTDSVHSNVNQNQTNVSSSQTTIIDNQSNFSGNQTIVYGPQINVGGNLVVNTGESYGGARMKVIQDDIITRQTGQERSVSDFNLDSVRQQLMQEYKDTRGKLPLLPGMPEECADMDDLFVDLTIVEEEKKPTGVIPRMLKSYDELVALKRKKDEKLKYRKGAQVDKKADFVRRLLIRGNPGAGKSTTVSKLAYDWACNKKDSPINNYKLLFAITINEINAESNIIDIIQDQLLPEVSAQSLKEYIQTNASSVVFLFDGYDEASQNFHNCKDIRNVLCSKWLQESCVIVTTRPNQVADFSDRYMSHAGPLYTQVEVRGFSEENRARYVAKFFSSGGNKSESSSSSEESDDSDDFVGNIDSFEGGISASIGKPESRLFSVSYDEDGVKRMTESNTKKFLEMLEQSPRLNQLTTMPIILSMLCLLWEQDQKLPTGITLLYRDLLIHLAKHNCARNVRSELDPERLDVWINNVLFPVGQVAIDGLFNDKLSFKTSCFEKHQLEEACLLGIVIKERKRSRVSVVHHATFLHKTFQEVCAAFYWRQLLETDRKKFDSYLKQITSNNVYDMEYLLRFTCGLSCKAAKIILPHVVEIMSQMIKTNGDFIYRCLDNQFAQDKLLQMLFEAVTNSQVVGNEKQLHDLLQPFPMFKKVIMKLENSCVRACVYLNKNVGAVLDYCSTSPNIADLGDSWLSGVENVIIIRKTKRNSRNDDYYNCDDGVKMLCCMTNISVLDIGCLFEMSNEFEFEFSVEEENERKYNIKPLLANLMVNRFRVIGLKELHFRSITADVNQLLEFMSSMPALTKLTFERVEIQGTMTGTFSCTSLKEFDCRHNSGIGDLLLAVVSSQACHLELEVAGVRVDLWIPLFRWFIEMIEQQRSGKVHASHERHTVPPFFTVKEICIGNAWEDYPNCTPACMYTIGKGIGYMSGKAYLKRLELIIDNGTCHYSNFLDGFIEAVEKLPRQTESDVMNEDLVRECNGLEDLRIFRSGVGESAEKLARVLKYMPCLRSLELMHTQMNSSQWAKIFNAFIELGEMRVAQNHKTTSDGAGSYATKHSGLALENITISNNALGDSVEKLAQAFRYMTYLKHLDLSYLELNVFQWEILFDGFIDAINSIDRTKNESIKESDTSHLSILPFQKLSLCDCKIGDSVRKLAKAYQYMPNLRCLNLRSTDMNPSQCAVLFDGFIEAGQRLEKHNDRNRSIQGDLAGASQGGLSIEELRLGKNDIGEAVEKLAQAYKYMPQLRILQLNDAQMKNPSQCAVLFDAFIEAGQRLRQQRGQKSQTQDSISSEPQIGLRLESLGLSSSEIGESFDMLCQALEYMPYLRGLDLMHCKLHENQVEILDKLLTDINKNFEFNMYLKTWKVW